MKNVEKRKLEISLKYVELDEDYIEEGKFWLYKSKGTIKIEGEEGKTFKITQIVLENGRTIVQGLYYFNIDKDEPNYWKKFDVELNEIKRVPTVDEIFKVLDGLETNDYQLWMEI